MNYRHTKESQFLCAFLNAIGFSEDWSSTVGSRAFRIAMKTPTEEDEDDCEWIVDWIQSPLPIDLLNPSKISDLVLSVMNEFICDMTPMEYSSTTTLSLLGIKGKNGQILARSQHEARENLVLLFDSIPMITFKISNDDDCDLMVSPYIPVRQFHRLDFSALNSARPPWKEEEEEKDFFYFYHTCSFAKAQSFIAVACPTSGRFTNHDFFPDPALYLIESWGGVLELLKLGFQDGSYANQQQQQQLRSST